MNNKKFKVGDRVRIINCSFIEPYELNKIGTVVHIRIYDDEWITYIVDMGRPRRPNNLCGDETCWYLKERMIELVNKPNEQLVFGFMDD